MRPHRPKTSIGLFVRSGLAYVETVNATYMPSANVNRISIYDVEFRFVKNKRNSRARTKATGNHGR